MSRSNDLTNGYTIVVPSETEQADLLKNVIPPRRGPTASVPGVALSEGLLMADEMYTFARMPNYLGLVTAEMKSRPIPHIFREEETRALDELYAEWYPDLLGWIVPQIRAPYQAYNKTSKVGWPGFFIPPDKFAYVSHFMPEVLAGDLSRFEGAFISMNVRLQVDSLLKERDFLFLDSDGTVTSRLIDAKAKSVRTPVGPRTGSRTRLVFNLPVYNLIKQVWDSAVGDVYNKWPAFHHNIFGGELLPIRGKHICLDVKHFERHTAACNRTRAAAIGGVYGACGALTAKLPFVVPTSDWKGARMAYVNREAGWSDQYASGDSAVAPSQKEILHVIYAAFFVSQLGYSRETALNQVAVGGEARLTIRNFGDDNSIDGDPAVLDDFMAFAGQYLSVQEEDPPKFLGFIEERGKWMLPPLSYLQKTYQNERRPGSNFRKYPFLGWVERRNIYKKLGHPDIVRIWEEEDQLLNRVGLPWYRILELADKERRDAFFAREDATNPYLLQNKEYLLTPIEQKNMGTHQLLEPATTGRMLKQLVSKSIAAKLQL